MLDEIMKSCKYVVNNSKSVKINEKQIDKFVEKINKVETKHWLSFSPYNLLDLPTETIINFLLVYDAIDFSFWGEPKWEINTINGKESGSIALLYAILKYVKDNNTTDFSNITKDEFREILKGNVEIPLFEERYKIITNVSKIVNEKMNKNFYEFIKNITNDIELFDVIIKYFQNFKDERIYNGKPIYLYKLAQLLTSDILHIRKLKEHIKVDYSHLVGCADYKIPQVMRGLGILEYSDELADIIDSKTVVELFDSQGTSLFKTIISSTRVVSTSISDDNKYLAIAQVDTSGTMIQSNIKVMSIDDAKNNTDNTIKKEYKGENNDLITNIKYQEKNKLLCMYTDKITEIKTDETVEKIQEFKDKKISFASIELSNASITIEEKSSGLFTADSVVNIINSDNKSTSLYTAELVTKEIYTTGNIIALNLGAEVEFINTSGWLVKRYTAEQEITSIVISNSIAGIVYRDKIEIINL